MTQIALEIYLIKHAARIYVKQLVFAKMKIARLIKTVQGMYKKQHVAIVNVNY